jgi:predicted ATP-dependent endonuclease of OLD family
LVGKNEAGKSAILQALNGLNPHPSTPFAYDKERDYPRRYLGQYQERHQSNEAVVVSTKWQLTDDERRQIDKEFGGGTLSNKPVVVSRAYGASEPKIAATIDYKAGVKHLISSFALNEEESKSLSDAENSEKLRKALEALAQRTERQEKLLQKLNGFPGQNLAGAITTRLREYLPQFMYFSYYDRMQGDIRLDDFNDRKAQNAIKVGEQVFIDFLELAGTSVQGILASTTYESLNAKCEAASAEITDQLKEYWTQNAFLEIEVRVTKAEPSDPAPFNTGVVARARVKNNLHRLTLPFSERSAGFIWFFSFLVKFSRVKNNSTKPLVLLLDEPGLTLHAKAQEDLLRYFADKLVPTHQLIFSTHSPFLVPADQIETVRIVEDQVLTPRPGVWTSQGTKVRSDVMAVDRDTLFPLQGALGYEVTQSLFIGKHTLLVEGPGDVLYLHVLSAALRKRGRTGLDKRWTICPAGGLDKIQPFVSLFWSAKLDLAVLTDFAQRDQRKIDALVKNKILESDRILTIPSLLGMAEGDVEDIFGSPLFLEMVNGALGLSGANELTEAKLTAETTETRLLKKVEALCRLLPPGTPEFDHFVAADWLVRNPAILDGTGKDVTDALDRAEKVCIAVNKLLPVT